MTNDSPVALIHGAGCSIGNELATNLATQGLKLVLFDTSDRVTRCEETAARLNSSNALQIETLPSEVPNSEIITHVVTRYQRLDYLFNVVTPDASTPESSIFFYPQQLLERNVAAAQAMVKCGSAGAIVNQWFVGCLFQGTALEAAVLMGRGAITGVTRDICVNFGKSGIRINTLQLGLVELPETKGLITEKTLARQTPVGRWGTASEAAKFMSFLALRNGYMSGQSICFDGGLTAGNTGT